MERVVFLGCHVGGHSPLAATPGATLPWPPRRGPLSPGRHAGGHSPLAATFYFLFFGVWLVKLSGLWYSVYWSFVILRRLLYAAEVGYADEGIESV